MIARRIVLTGLLGGMTVLSFIIYDQHKQENLATNPIALSTMTDAGYFEPFNMIYNAPKTAPVVEAVVEEVAPAKEVAPVKVAPAKVAPVKDKVVEKEVVKEPTVKKTIMEVTAYTAGYESTGKSPGHPEYGKTASTAYVKQGVTIAAGKNIPFGTKIYIPFFDGKPGFGDGVFTVQDRGGAIKAHNIDVYMESLSEAQEFGRQQLEVKILEG